MSVLQQRYPESPAQAFLNPVVMGTGRIVWLLVSRTSVKRHGRIEPVRIDDFDELDVFEEFVTALFRTNTDRRQKAINDKLWEFVILL